MKNENIIKPSNGYFSLILVGILVLCIPIFGATGTPVGAIGAFVLMLFLIRGLIVIRPNTGVLLLLFGEYKGSVKQPGLFWVNPFYSRTTLSLRARNFESEKVKVNDKMGNPIMIIR